MAATLYTSAPHHLNTATNKILIAAEIHKLEIKRAEYSALTAKPVLPSSFFFISSKLRSSDCEAVLLSISVEDLAAHPRSLELLNLGGRLHAALQAVVYPSLGLIKECASERSVALEHLQRILEYLEGILKYNKFLTSNAVKICDISIFCELLPLYEMVFDSSIHEKFPHVFKYMKACAEMPAFKKIIKKIDFYTGKTDYLSPGSKGQKNVSSDEEKSPGKSKKKKNRNKKEKSPSSSCQKEKEGTKSQSGDKKPKKDEKKDEKKEPEAQAPKKDPFSSLPETKFDFEAWKRVYFNQDIEKEAIPWFWNNYDPETMGIWFGNYKYNDEFSKGFMIENFLTGVFSRVEKLRKIAFAVVYIAGSGEGNFELTSVWVFRGQGLAFEIDPDYNQDAPLFEFRKLSADSSEDKQIVHDYFVQKKEFRKFPLYKALVFS